MKRVLLFMFFSFLLMSCTDYSKEITGKWAIARVYLTKDTKEIYRTYTYSKYEHVLDSMERELDYYYNVEYKDTIKPFEVRLLQRRIVQLRNLLKNFETGKSFDQYMAISLGMIKGQIFEFKPDGIYYIDGHKAGKWEVKGRNLTLYPKGYLPQKSRITELKDSTMKIIFYMNIDSLDKPVKFVYQYTKIKSK